MLAPSSEMPIARNDSGLVNEEPRHAGEGVIALIAPLETFPVSA